MENFSLSLMNSHMSVGSDKSIRYSLTSPFPYKQEDGK